MLLLVSAYFGRLRWIHHEFEEDFARDVAHCVPRLQECLKRISLPSFEVAGKIVVFHKAEYDPVIYSEAIDEEGARRAVLSPREKGQRLEILRFLVCTPGCFQTRDRRDGPCLVEEFRLVIDDVKVFPDRDPILGRLYLERRQGECSLKELSFPETLASKLGDPNSERLMRNVRSVVLHAGTASVNARVTPLDLTVICQAPLPESQTKPVKALLHVELNSQLRFHHSEGKR